MVWLLGLIVLLATAVPVLASAKAGPNVGGGGNAVVCFSDPAIPAAIRDEKNPFRGQILDRHLTKVSSIETYDLYVAKMPSGLENIQSDLIEPEAGQPLRDYSEQIARRFEPYVPFVSDMIREGSDNFPDEQILLRPDGLNRIFDENDSAAYIDPVHCVIATMATQYKIGKQLFMQIDERLYRHEKHSVLSQAVLFLHEAIYSTVRWRAVGAHENSRNTRLLIRRLIVKKGVRAKEIDTLLNSLGFARNDGGKFGSRSGSVDTSFLSAWAKRNDEMIRTELQKVMSAHDSRLRPYFKKYYSEFAEKIRKIPGCETKSIFPTWVIEYCLPQWQAESREWRRRVEGVTQDLRKKLTEIVNGHIQNEIDSLTQYTLEERKLLSEHARSIIARTKAKQSESRQEQHNNYAVRLTIRRSVELSVEPLYSERFQEILKSKFNPDIPRSQEKP